MSGSFRIFNITGAFTVGISGMTISNGNIGGSGGGVFNSVGAVTLNGVTVSGNTAALGAGGVYNGNGTTTILNSTISGNFAANSGAGIYVGSGTVNVANSTVSGNTITGFSFASCAGIENYGTLNMNNVTVAGNIGNADANSTGGVFQVSGTVNARNTIISGNTASGSTSKDVKGTFVSQGTNAIGNATGSTGFTQPGDTVGAVTLGALANNGGATDTHLPSGANVIDAGSGCVLSTLFCAGNSPPVALITDQRGATRQSSTRVDKGAFEVAPFVTNNPAGTALNFALADTGDGSLRNEIANDSAAGDTIYFDPSFFDRQRNIDLTSATLSISKNLTIAGTGARFLTVRRSSGSTSIFSISGAGTVVGISGMTISNGTSGVFNNGAALTLSNVSVSGNSTSGIAQNSGTTTILNSTVSNNTGAADGAGISIGGGTVNIADTTISGNSTTLSFGTAGAIENFGTLNMNNVTITNNSVTGNNPTNAGGVRSVGTTNTRNTIISGNTASGSTSPDVNGVFTSQGSNLIGTTTVATGFTQPTDKTNVAANLGGLANNGGQTDTHLPLAGSPAINAGNNCVVTGICGLNNPPAPLVFDQRGAGFPRDSGGITDIGAIESAVLQPTASEVVVSGRAMTADGRGIKNVMIQMTGADGATRTTTTGANGFYRFDKVAAGETYIVSVRGKSFGFSQPTQVVNATGDETEINFVAYASDRVK